MSEAWPIRELGSVLSRVRRPVTVIDGEEYPAVSVTKDGQGLGVKEPFVGGVTTYKRLFRVHAGDVVVRTITAFESPVGVANELHDGTHVSQVFLTYEVADAVMPEYLRLIFQTNAFWEEMRNRAQGTVLRRKTISDENFRGIPVALPPLSLQRQIVDVVERLDNQVDRLHAEAQAARELLRPLLVSLVEKSEEVTWVPLGDVGEFIRGRRFTKRDYVPSGLGCIHYGQIHTHFGHIITESVTFLPEGLRSRLRVARPGDVVVAAASEDIDGLGKATVWMGDEDVAVHDDCFIFRNGLDPRFASFLFDSPWFHNQKRKYASGMKVARILGDNLARIEVPVPSMETQRQVGDALSQLIAEAEALEAEEVALRRLRGSLLTLLISGRHAIPESYKEFMGVAS